MALLSLPPFDIVFPITMRPTVCQLTSRDCQRLEALDIAVVYLFGSHAEGAASERSDVDIGIVVRHAKQLAGDTMPLYLALFDVFGKRVPDSNRLDIVFLQRAPLELRFDVVANGVPLFTASEDVRLDFEERTTLAYCDFQPILREFDRSILENS